MAASNPGLDGMPPLDASARDLMRAFDVEIFAARYSGVLVTRVDAGALVYRQGEPADSMFYVRSGQLRSTVLSSQGKEAILGLVEPGDWCGEGCLLGGRVRVATVTCVADSVVARVERASMLRAIRENPDFSEYFLIMTLTHGARLRSNLISQLFDSSEKKLARALVLLANHGGADGTADKIKNIDQEALAQMIGTTRSRVNYFMNKFRKLNYIDYDTRGIVVHRSLSDFALPEWPETPGGEELIAC